MHFPAVPDPLTEAGESLVTLKENKTVTMPFDYWQKIVRFMLESERVKKQYHAWEQIIFEYKEKKHTQWK